MIPVTNHDADKSYAFKAHRCLLHLLLIPTLVVFISLLSCLFSPEFFDSSFVTASSNV